MQKILRKSSDIIYDIIIQTNYTTDDDHIEIQYYIALSC